MAEEYFEDSCNEGGIPTETIEQIYKGDTLTRDMVLSIIESPNWKQLEEGLLEIGYPFDFQ